MKIFKFAFLLSVIGNLFFPAIEPISPANINIGIIGDQTGSSNLDVAYVELQKGAKLLSQTSPDVIVHIGDLIESTQDTAAIKQRFAKAVSILNNTNVFLYLTPGDHDVNPPKFKQNSSDDSKKLLYKSLYSEINPLIKDHLYYSFDVQDYHCIVLDSLEHLHTDPRWGNVFFSQLSQQQYLWLENDLEKNKDKKGSVIFLHQPLWYNWSSWYKIHKLLQKYHILAVVAGHFHYYQDDGLIDNIHYVIVGATGADIKDANTNAGGKHHITLMSIYDDKSVEFTLLPTDDSPAFKFPTRYEMDRVQALDQMLGNLWNFNQINPVFLKEKELVNSCDKVSPATLTLFLGNPLEIPVDFAIEYMPPSSDIVLKLSQFADDVCQITHESFRCLAAPSARIFVSNPSTVEIDNDPSKQPFWSGRLSLLSQANAQPNDIVGKLISLYVHATFVNDKQKQFVVQKKVGTKILSCPSANVSNNHRNDDL